MHVAIRSGWRHDDAKWCDMAIMLLALAVVSQPSIPFKLLGDETLAERIEVDPKQFLDRPVIMVGGLTTSNYFNYGYRESKDTHYALDFYQIVSTAPLKYGKKLNFYINRNLPFRIAGTIIETVVAAANDQNRKLARVKVVLYAEKYRIAERDSGYGAWTMLELLDVQFANEKGEWGPWLVASAQARLDDINKKNAAAEREAFIVEQERKAEAEKAAQAAKIAADTRTWTSGTYSIKAQFVRMANGKVTLKKEDGTQLTIETEKLSAEDRDWLKKRSNR
jgi:hypothetical protein